MPSQRAASLPGCLFAPSSVFLHFSLGFSWLLLDSLGADSLPYLSTLFVIDLFGRFF